MSKERLSDQLAREAREYLADLREIVEDLKSVEGWIALALLLAAVAMTAVWFVVSLGFNPGNDHVLAFAHSLGMRSCRPVSNFDGVVMFVDFFLLLFLTLISLGNVINMMRRAREGRPREPRDLVISAALMLVVGVGGIFFMLWVC